MQRGIGRRYLARQQRNKIRRIVDEPLQQLGPSSPELIKEWPHKSGSLRNLHRVFRHGRNQSCGCQTSAHLDRL